jgi:putative ATPase
VKQTGDLPVPIHLHATTKLMKELGYGEEYKYAHDYNNNFADQNFTKKHLKTPIYIPGTILEKTASEFLKNRWKINMVTKVHKKVRLLRTSLHFYKF